MPHLADCPYCGEELVWNGRHYCPDVEQPTAREAWRALVTAPAKDRERARAIFVKALERVGA